MLTYLCMAVNQKACHNCSEATKGDQTPLMKHLFTCNILSYHEHVIYRFYTKQNKSYNASHNDSPLNRPPLFLVTHVQASTEINYTHIHMGIDPKKSSTIKGWPKQAFIQLLMEKVFILIDNGPHWTILRRESNASQSQRIALYSYVSCQLKTAPYQTENGTHYPIPSQNRIYTYDHLRHGINVLDQSVEKQQNATDY